MMRCFSLSSDHPLSAGVLETERMVWQASTKGDEHEQTDCSDRRPSECREVYAV